MMMASLCDGSICTSFLPIHSRRHWPLKPGAFLPMTAAYARPTIAMQRHGISSRVTHAMGEKCRALAERRDMLRRAMADARRLACSSAQAPRFPPLPPPLSRFLHCTCWSPAHAYRPTVIAHAPPPPVSKIGARQTAVPRRAERASR